MKKKTRIILLVSGVIASALSACVVIWLVYTVSAMREAVLTGDEYFEEAQEVILEQLQKKYDRSFKVTDMVGEGWGHHYLGATAEDMDGNSFGVRCTTDKNGHVNSYEDGYFYFIVKEDVMKELESLIPEEFPEYYLQTEFYERYYSNSLTVDSDLDDLKNSEDYLGISYYIYISEEAARSLNIKNLLYQTGLMGKKNNLTGDYSCYIVKNEAWSDIEQEANAEVTGPFFETYYKYYVDKNKIVCIK